MYFRVIISTGVFVCQGCRPAPGVFIKRATALRGHEQGVEEEEEEGASKERF